jgi:hypothetical protein
MKKVLEKRKRDMEEEEEFFKKKQELEKHLQKLDINHILKESESDQDEDNEGIIF